MHTFLSVQIHSMRIANVSVFSKSDDDDASVYSRYGFKLLLDIMAMVSGYVVTVYVRHVLSDY